MRFKAGRCVYDLPKDCVGVTAAYVRERRWMIMLPQVFPEEIGRLRAARGATRLEFLPLRLQQAAGGADAAFQLPLLAGGKLRRLLAPHFHRFLAFAALIFQRLRHIVHIGKET